MSNSCVAVCLQAQQVADKEAATVLADAPRKSGSSLGVQFFGTCQVAWVAPDETSAWGEGIRKNYYGKEKKQKKYKLAMTQVQPATGKSC